MPTTAYSSIPDRFVTQAANVENRLKEYHIFEQKTVSGQHLDITTFQLPNQALYSKTDIQKILEIYIDGQKADIDYDKDGNGTYQIDTIAPNNRLFFNRSLENENVYAKLRVQ